MSLPQTTKMDRLTLYASTIAFQWAAAGVVVWRATAHGIRPGLLGLSIPRPALTLTLSVLLSLLFLTNQVFSIKRTVSRPSELKSLLPQLALKVFPQDNVERLAFVALVCTVAVCEELIYRGFVQYVFQDVAGRVVVGIILSAVFFALAHFYQGRRGLVSTFAVGLIFAVIRSWTRSLIPPISAHFVADLTVGLLAPIQLRGAARQSRALSPPTAPPSTEKSGQVS